MTSPHQHTFATSVAPLGFTAAQAAFFMEVSNFKSQALLPPRVFRSGLAALWPLPYYLSPLPPLPRPLSRPLSP